MGDERHYLQEEFYQKLRSDDGVIEFLQAGALDGVWYWDLENPEHEWMSAKFWQTFGYDPAERQHLASEWQDLIHPEDLEVALANFNAHCDDPNHPYDQYVRYRHREGHWVTVRCKGFAVRDDSGKPIRMFGVHVDSTELKESLERERLQLLENNELNLFAYAAAHDLQAPIKSMTGLVQLLRDEIEMGRGAAPEVIDTIGSSLQRMQSLVDSVLFLARAKSTTLERAKVSLADIVAAVIREIELPDDCEIECQNLSGVYGNESALQRAIRNLILNCINHRVEHRPLKISIEQRSGQSVDEILVEDNGIGIPGGLETELLRPFARKHGSGHGLGLAIVDRIARAHGGFVEIDGLENGARVTMTLARVEDEVE